MQHCRVTTTSTKNEIHSNIYLDDDYLCIPTLQNY